MRASESDYRKRVCRTVGSFRRSECKFNELTLRCAGMMDHAIAMVMGLVLCVLRVRFSPVLLHITVAVIGWFESLLVYMF